MQKHLSLKFTTIKNTNIYSIFLDIIILKLFKSFNMQKMHNALLKFKVFKAINISSLEIRILTLEIIDFLLFEYMQYIIEYF